MSELYLLRHAKAVPQEAGGSDRDRPLEQRGRHAAQAVARWIEEQRISPDLVLCSPSLRTRQTLDIVAPAFARPPEFGSRVTSTWRAPASCWTGCVNCQRRWRD